MRKIGRERERDSEKEVKKSWNHPRFIKHGNEH